MSADALGSPKATVTAFWSKCATRPLLCKQIGGNLWLFMTVVSSLLGTQPMNQKPTFLILSGP